MGRRDRGALVVHPPPVATVIGLLQDAIPGMEIPVWFEATMTTEEFLKTTIGTAREGQGFEIACAQLCGLGHYRMKGFMTIHDDL